MPFLHFLEHIGAPAERRLADFMIPLEALYQPETLVPLNQAFLFLERNAQAEGLENLGVLAARQIHIGELGAFGRILRQSLTLADAIMRAAELIPRYNSAHRIWLDSWHGLARICHCYVGDVGQGRKYGDQFTLGLLIDLVRVVAGPRWLPAEIHVEHGIAGGAQDDLFDAPIRERDVSAIVFDKALLGRAFGQPGGDGSRAATGDHDLLRETAPAADFVTSMRQVIDLFVRDNRLELDQIAKLTGLSTRSLQRRLAECGIEYSDMVAHARFDHASKLLADRAIPVTDIAHELGYSDASNFTRAFRKWTGLAPSAYRAGLMAGK